VNEGATEDGPPDNDPTPPDNDPTPPDNDTSPPDNDTSQPDNDATTPGTGVDFPESCKALEITAGSQAYIDLVAYNELRLREHNERRALHINT